MNLTEQLAGSHRQIVDSNKSACLMLNDQGQEIRVTQAMVVSLCQQLIKQCRNIKN
ncbi:PA1571 family protein [Acinetobacter sp. DSM 11652]|uniref:PA1571 family protein n=1 Tax=Acinetobacter sp. DSM 11652 TaxID=346222 RepID=UPI0008D626AF|nr:PA1571 family protein [Acinetobacter sp. DSM 11652]SEL84593.1 hypothetical protein SAMN05216500_106114 [Acinetobacter sp. DSM 11652]